MATNATDAVAAASPPLSLSQQHASLSPFQPSSAALDSDQSAGEWGIGDLTAWMGSAFRGDAVATTSLPLSLSQQHASLPLFQPNFAALDNNPAAAAAADVAGAEAAAAAGAAASAQIAGELGIRDLAAWMGSAFTGNAVATTSLPALPLSPCQQHSLPSLKPNSAAPDSDQAAAAPVGAAGAVAAGQSGGEWGLDDLTAWMDKALKCQAANAEDAVEVAKAAKAAEVVEAAEVITTPSEGAAAPLLGTAGTRALPYPDALLLASPDFPASLQSYLSDEPVVVGTAPTTRTLRLQPDSRPFAEAGSHGGLLCQRPLCSAREKQHNPAPRCTLPGRESQVHESAWKAVSEAEPLSLGNFMGASGFGLPVGPTVGRFSFLDGNILGSNGSTGMALDGVSSSPESSSGPPFGAVPTTRAGVMNVSCQLRSDPVTHGLLGRGVAANTVLFNSRREVLASVLDGMAAVPNAAMAGHAAAGTSAATPVPVPLLPVAADATETAAGNAAGNAAHLAQSPQRVMAANAAGKAAPLARISPASDGSLGARRPPTGRRSDKERLRRHRFSAGLKRLEKAIPAAWLRRKYPVNLTARADIASLLNAAVTFIDELEVHKAKLFQIHVQELTGRIPMLVHSEKGRVKKAKVVTTRTHVWYHSIVIYVWVKE